MTKTETYYTIAIGYDNTHSNNDVWTGQGFEKDNHEPYQMSKAEAEETFDMINKALLAGDGFKNQTKNTVHLIKAVVTFDDDGDFDGKTEETIKTKAIKW